MRKTHVLLLLFASMIHFGFTSKAGEEASLPGTWLDLTNAVIVTPTELSGPEKKAVTMLVEEVDRRCGVRWEVANALPGETSFIAVGQASRLRASHSRIEGWLAREPASSGAEGYRIATEVNATTGSSSRATIRAACCLASDDCFAS